MTASAIPFLLVAVAQTRIPSSVAAILNGSLPLVTALLAIGLDPDGRIRGWRNAGLVIGFAGVALVALTRGSVGPDGNVLGILAMFGAVLSYAYAAHLAKRRFTGVEPVHLTLSQLLISSAVMVPLALLVARPDHVPSVDTFAALAGVGLLGTSLAWCLYYWLLGRAGPQHAVAVQYLAPVAAVVYGALILGESVSLSTVLGMILIISGEIIVAMPSWSRSSGRASAHTHGSGTLD
jgi:drug/metabolite transporter (DMT)-like permease